MVIPSSCIVGVTNPKACDCPWCFNTRSPPLVSNIMEMRSHQNVSGPNQRYLSSFSMQRLANTKAHTSRFISANLPCNKFKNRLVNIMPYESTRVCLQPIRGVEGSDYINASFIDGYR